MHMHACDLPAMRTTIELPDELRAKLLAMAARRGEKGFSGLIQAAVARYLEEEELRQSVVRRALSAIGSLDDDEAERLRESVRQFGSSWRSS